MKTFDDLREKPVTKPRPPRVVGKHRDLPPLHGAPLDLRWTRASGVSRGPSSFLARHELCAIAALGIFLMTGCRSPSSPSGHEFALGNGDNGRLLFVGLGDEIDVTLQTIGPGEYDELPSVSSAAVTFLSVSLLTPSNPAGPKQLFQFRAVATGHAVISIPHTGQNPRFGITVDVR